MGDEGLELTGKATADFNKGPQKVYFLAALDFHLVQRISLSFENVVLDPGFVKDVIQGINIL